MGLIGAGVFMLMQPFSLALYGWSFATILAGTVLFMEGQVRDAEGLPIPGAVVDVWHANTKGGYSFFDPSQSAWNLRRRIETDGEGRYRFRSILPSGYGCPPDGPTQELSSTLLNTH